eukprot:1987491-Amphidinium_carterae.2
MMQAHAVMCMLAGVSSMKTLDTRKAVRETKHDETCEYRNRQPDMKTNQSRLRYANVQHLMLKLVDKEVGEALLIVGAARAPAGVSSHDQTSASYMAASK